jgi:hypothetical protein
MPLDSVAFVENSLFMKMTTSAPSSLLDELSMTSDRSYYSTDSSLIIVNYRLRFFSCVLPYIF